MPKATSILHCHIDPEVHDGLRSLAKEAGLSVTAFVEALGADALQLDGVNQAKVRQTVRRLKRGEFQL